MLDNALLVAGQVLILFLLIGTGFFMGKIKWLNEQGLRQMTQLLLMVVTPCVIVESFLMEFSASLLRGLLISGASAIATHLIGIVFSRFAFRKQQRPENQKVLRFSVIFSNCGFMCIPLLYAVLGPVGVFYGSAYIAIFNTVQWTYGVVLMTGSAADMNLRKALLNPGTIGLSVGLLFYLTGIRLPQIPGTVVSSLAALNTPLAMIIIGGQMSAASLMEILRSRTNYYAAAWRLFVVPLVILIPLIFLPLDRTLLIACLIPASAPAAAATALFATRFRQNALLATHLVSLTTILSILTMPFMILLADMLYLLR